MSNLFIMHFVFGRKNCRSEEETGFCMWVYLILAAWSLGVMKICDIEECLEVLGLVID